MSYGITPDRRTRLRLDVPTTTCTELAYECSRWMEDLAQGPQASTRGLKFDPSTGWSLVATNDDIGRAQQTLATTADGIVLDTSQTGGTLQISSACQLEYGSTPPSDLPDYNIWGNPTGAVKVHADPYYQLQLGAGVDPTSVGLAVTQSTNPVVPLTGVPLTMAPLQPVISIAQNTVPMDPGQPFYLKFWVPGSHRQASDWVLFLYFTGPASSGPYEGSIDHNGEGTGFWCLAFKGDGTVYLLEWVENIYYNDSDPNRWSGGSGLAWYEHDWFRWCEPSRVYGSAHRIYISNIAYGQIKNNSSGVIVIQSACSESSQSGGIFGAYATSASGGNLAVSRRFTVPATTFNPTTSGRIQIDTRCDNKVKFQISYPTGQNIATMLDGPITLVGNPYWAGSGVSSFGVMAVQVYGLFPNGTSLNIGLLDCSTTPSTPLTPLSTAPYLPGSGPYSYYAYFKLNPLSSTYQGQITVNGAPNSNSNAAGTVTPVIQGIDYYKPAAYNLIAPGETVVQALYPGLMGVGVTGPGDGDASHETASLHVEDPTGTLASYVTRGGIPSIVDSTYNAPAGSPYSGAPIDWTNSVNNGRQAVLIQGWSDCVTGMQKGVKDENRMWAPNWKSYDFDVFGEWQRVAQCVTPCIVNFGQDFNPDTANKPWKVTDAIAQLLLFAGVNPAQLNMGSETLVGRSTQFDLDTRLYPPADSKNGLTIAMGSNILDVIKQFAFDYLQAGVIFDPSMQYQADYTGQYQGMWTLLGPSLRLIPYYTGSTEQVYNPLAYFQTLGPQYASITKLLLPHVVDAYPPVKYKDGQGNPTAQWLIGAPVHKRSLKQFIKPPEANIVRICGTQSVAGSDETNQLVQVYYNPNSCQFDPTSPAPTIISGSGYPNTYPDGTPNLDYLPKVVLFERMSPSFTNQPAVDTVARLTGDRICYGKNISQFEAPLIFVMDSNQPLQVRPRLLRWYDCVFFNGTAMFVKNCNPDVKKSSMQKMYVELESITTPYKSFAPTAPALP